GAGRLAAGQREQARPVEEHAARARPEPARLGREATARAALRAGHDPALLRGARLPRRLAHTGDDQRSERRPADLVVQPDATLEGEAEGLDRLLEDPAVAPYAPDRAGRGRADRP